VALGPPAVGASLCRSEPGGNRDREIEAAARSAVLEVTQNGRRRVTALAVAGQGQTFVALDGRDQPLHPAILWYDSRAAAQATAFRQRLDALGAEGVVELMPKYGKSRLVRPLALQNLSLQKTSAGGRTAS